MKKAFWLVVGTLAAIAVGVAAFDRQFIPWLISGIIAACIYATDRTLGIGGFAYSPKDRVLAVLMAILIVIAGPFGVEISLLCHYEDYL